MKKLYFTITFLLCGLLFVNAQSIERIKMGDEGTPRLIKFDTKTKSYSKAEAKKVLRTNLALREVDDLRRFRTEKDNFGYEHERYQQYFNGVKVEYGVYNVHSKAGKIKSINGNFKQIDKKFKLNKKITEKRALEIAKNYVGANTYMWEDANAEAWAKKTEKTGTFKPEAELVLVPNTMANTKEEFGQLRLAYKLNIYAKAPVSRAHIYVDAKTGKVIHKNDIIKTVVANGQGDTRYSGTKSFKTDSYNGSYRMRDYSRGNGIIIYDMNEGTNYNSAVDFTDYDNNWTASEYHNTNKDDIASEAMWAYQEIYDYWTNVHGRNSFDGNGALQKVYVHYDQNYDNAYWNGSVFTFGDGSDTYFDALASLDVSAHEHGHAVCSYTADLTYSYESGALNEAFSDIWGACLEAYAAPEKNIWVIGDDIERRAGHEGLRDMSDPKAEGLPDTYQGQNWVTGSSDNGGVHTNNGPYCYWFYLISEGGSGTNDNGKSYNIQAIGINKAEKIAYRVESVYMTNSSDYADARTYSIQAAEDLYGAGSNEVIQVTNAMAAIGVGDDYCDGCVSYCESKGNDASYEWIAGVTIGAFTNTSNGAGYTDFTSQTVTVNAGQSYSVSLEPGFGSSTYNEYWKIWIDLNGDGDFSDANELVFDAGSMSKTTVTGTMTIPSVSGITTRMRVSMKYNGAQTACEAFSYGEVEDYTVTIQAGGDTQAPTAPSNLTASNVQQTTLTLSWNASSDNVGVTEYEVFQGGSSLGTVTGTSANITGLTENTSYSFYVKAKDAAGNVSSASNTVNVTTLSADDTQAPTAPSSLAASNVGQTSLTLSWNASSDNVGVTGYDVYRNGSLYASVTGTSANVTGLIKNTTYSFYVKAKDAAGNVSSSSNTINVTTLDDVVVTYCASKGNNANYEWIDLVRLGSIDNTTSKNGGYADFTSMSTNVARGTQYTIYISAGMSSTYTEYWNVWIDFNNDGDFTDAGENVVSGSSSSTATLSASFTIPSTATLGSTRMRVSMKYNANATSCETFSYGEVEDYTVNITSTAFTFAGTDFSAEELGNEEPMFTVYPTAAKDILNIAAVGNNQLKIKVVSMNGTVVKQEILTGRNQVNVSELPAGVYTIDINDGRKSTIRRFMKL